MGLRRRGYHVVGLVRDIAKAKTLLLNEIEVIVGDLLKPETWVPEAKECNILIHTAADYSNYDVVDETTVDNMLKISADRGSGAKKLVIYTSGILV